MQKVIYTIGHSTRRINEFIDILKTYGIKQLVDVRTLPGSNKFPHFNKENMAEVLPANNIAYQHIKALGGLRPTSKSSINTGWHNKSFRGYADYMQSDKFRDAVEELVKIAEEKTTAIMCAEAVPWRCHRSLIGDAMLVRDFTVLDIFSEKKAEPHTLTSFAKVEGTAITYPPEEE